jgi:asparagine N-glycosylation enzyme membrane subunit Stt3
MAVEWDQVTIAAVVVGGVSIVFLAIDGMLYSKSAKVLAPMVVFAFLLVIVVAFSVQAGRWSHISKGISEMAPIDGREYLAYLALIPAMILGVLALAKRKHFRRADAFLVCWIGVTLVLGLVSRRLWVFSVPAYCVLSGIGIGWIWKRHLLPKWAVAGILAILVGFSGYYAYHIDMGDPRTSATPEMQQACQWIRENSADNATVLAWWDWGYMIEDLSEREAAMDNGSHAKGRLDHTWLAMQGFGDDEDYAVEVAMRRTGSDYLLVYRDFPAGINERSFCNRVFEGQTGGHVEVVYRTDRVAIVTVST